ncbi:DNA mismatch repair endonuclease MutL [Faecalibacterium sp. I4-3-84]|uniref:DNA mismatch repair endonuclease MutL n=1 Tax=unclassified Faecalibacterium TaxID=2646395 RepID=UPI002014A14C|nr:DNA mismatch repair endonuclease MutL [Faecalibacterium sp. I4-3-84]UQK37413.1 DNA mismatch repair endonuclease MutL [Faecalibacterium sp. I4-3-84]HJI17832.1 DNA mismatch repair endonuclease MutL [Oscillospiraceae bacterium]
MAVIHVLDKHTAELIAAGEVVERPASVVKELLENSIDAGATQVTVSIESGGVKLIEISDNGTGIEAEYISTAFIRHATSKIETPDDLTNIHTLGFRGEALASIASVARVELTTRTEVDEFATVYRIEGGEEVSREPGARAVGTTIRVKDLFYNTPARMKFLKKDSSEGTFVSDTVTHVALSHPEVSVKFIREGKLQYVTPGDGQLRGAAYAVLGREFSRDLIELKNQEGVYRITGLVTPPKSCRASRSMQHFYINGRYVRNRTMMAGMEMAFKGTMMQGKFPGGILLLEMPADLVDVNVHPAKIEARFARENDVFDVVYHAVKLALAQPGTGERLFTFEADKEEKAENLKKDTDIIKNDVKNNNFTGLSAIIRGQADPGVLPQQHWEPAKPAAAPQQPAPSAAMQIPTAPSVPRWKGSAQNEDMLDPFVTLHSPKLETTKAPEPFRAAASETQLDVEPEFGETKLHSPQDHMAAWNPAQEAPKEEPESAPYVETEPDAPEAAEQETVLAEPEQMNFDPTADQPEPLRYVGEVFRTYILAERGDELCLIDKHAAHERQLYEKLAANYGNVPSQMLLEPAAIDLAAEEKQALLDNIPLLENAGLEIADFGGNTVVLRAVPADVEPQNAESLLVEIANKLLKGGHDALNEHTEWVLHSISCRAAIKAGDKSSPQELLALAEKILSGEVPPFCPHGRPCVLKLTRKELEKQFGRIV